MSSKCKICGSYAINPHSHGRKPRVDVDLCDVCYWRTRAEVSKVALEKIWDRTAKAYPLSIITMPKHALDTFELANPKRFQKLLAQALAMAEASEKAKK